MRPRADGLRQSTRGRLDGLKYAPGIREPEALALSGSRNPGVRLPSPIETARLRDLKPSRRNARTHQNKQIGQIRNSMLRFGWTYPILIDENHEIIAGFGRYQAAKHLGLRDVPVIVMTGG
jgi:hypothetical protein